MEKPEKTVLITQAWMKGMLSKMMDFGQHEFEAAIKEKSDGTLVLATRINVNRIEPLFADSRPVNPVAIGMKHIPDPDEAKKARAAAAEVIELPSGSTLRFLSASADEKGAPVVSNAVFLDEAQEVVEPEKEPEPEKESEKPKAPKPAAAAKPKQA